MTTTPNPMLDAFENLVIADDGYAVTFAGGKDRNMVYEEIRAFLSRPEVAALQDPGTDRSEGGEMNFCRDCKHYFNGQCKSPQAETERDPIAGDWPMARTMRLSESRACGTVKARWFEQKEKVNP